MKLLYEKYTRTGEPKVAETDVHVSRVMITDCHGIPRVEITDGPKGVEVRQAEEGAFLEPTRMLYRSTPDR